MEVLTDTSVYKFSPNTLEVVRKEFGLTHDAVVQMLDSFEEWINKQNHFTNKDFDRHYLETSIITAKGSLERAKNSLDKLCTLKTLLPNFYMKYDVKQHLTDPSGFLLQATFPILLKTSYRLFIVKVVSLDFDPEMLFDFHRWIVLMSEYYKLHDYSLGFTVVVDCRDINLVSLVTKVNIVDLRNMMSVVMEGYGLRINAIYLLSSSKTVDVLVTMFKQVVSAKIAGRINVVKTVEDLYEFIPKESFPSDYGGNQKSLKEVNANWREELSKKENVKFLKKISEARTDEKYRLSDKYNDQILGMPGSFRTLNVD